LVSRSIISPASTPGVLTAFRRALKSLQIFQCERAALDQIRDEKARGASKQIEEIANEPGPMLTLIDGRLKELRVPDLFDFAKSAFLFEPVHERLHGRVSNALIFGKAVEDLADRARSEFPVLLQDAGLGLRETGFAHVRLRHPAMLLQHP